MHNMATKNPPGSTIEIDLAQHLEDSFEFFKEIGVLVPVDPATLDPAEYP
jgi:hypothetical protein